MMVRAFIWLVAATLLSGPIGLAAEQAAPDTSRQRYDVLVERNMFSRQRGNNARGLRLAPEVVPPPEHFVVLTGLVRQNGEYIAFLEDTKKGTVTRVRAGDAVLDGQVSSVALDGIEYKKENSTVTVKLGQNLEGGERSSAFASTATAASGSGAVGTSPAAPPSAGSASAPPGDMLEQLKQRRQKELGQ